MAVKSIRKSKKNVNFLSQRNWYTKLTQPKSIDDLNIFYLTKILIFFFLKKKKNLIVDEIAFPSGSCLLWQRVPSSHKFLI